MSAALGKYFEFLLAQLQEDIRVVSIWWVHWFVFPMLVYFLFFVLKWWMLLVPVTMPLTIWVMKPLPPVTADKVALPPPSARN